MTVMLYSDLSDVVSTVELLEVLTCFLFCSVIVAGVCKRRKCAQHHHCCKLKLLSQPGATLEFTNVMSLCTKVKMMFV